MGNSQSSRANKTDSSKSVDALASVKSVRGRESKQLNEDALPGLLGSSMSLLDGDIMMTSANDFAVVYEESEEEEIDSEDDDDSDDEEEADEVWNERLAILADARRLQQTARMYLHPEAPIVTDATAFARCYFDRASAVATEDHDVAAAARNVAMDVAQLQQWAQVYQHPELAVSTSDVTACGRNYFARASAAVTDEEEEDERARILQDVAALKQAARDFMHPELPVQTSPEVLGRSYFSRPAAYEDEDEDERAAILADAQALKRVAVDFMHPERPVQASPEVFGRNYFERPSAYDGEDDFEREQALQDAKALKQLATDYLHPEVPVQASPEVFGRNYFSRPASAEEQDEDEREAIMADAKALQKLAVDYMHPERPVAVAAPEVFGRNYFARPAAYDGEDDDDRAQVLHDCLALKKLAVDYMHPESPVKVDGEVFGRNYFVRPSAHEDDQDAEERAAILADGKALKQKATDYLHPELPVKVSPEVYGRNYFNRPLAHDGADEDERSVALEDARAFKQLAKDYLHPEAPLKVDPEVFARNFFGRASAEDVEDDERELILADAKALKQVAIDYMHPEAPVQVDAESFGRNYFARPSAAENVDDDEADERSRVLADALALKKLAVAYAHPELPVVTTDSMATGRNYFDRPSAPLHERAIHTFPPHEDDVHHDESENAHLDHFGMDEELDFMFAEMRQDLKIPYGVDKAAPANKISDEEASNLSRSPSSVMLFTGESAYD